MTPAKTHHTLYICYFGLREALVQTQVIPYLVETIKDVNVSLLTFEPDLKKAWTVEEIETERAQLNEKGIEWHYLPYHKRPSVPATLYDILNGSRMVRRLIGRNDIDILHCRLHVPAVMAAIARKFSRKKPKLLFDIRGFFPEEYTDAGVWPENGWLYRTAKRIERWLFGEADGFVVLTKKARDILFPQIAGDESEGAHFDNQNRPVEIIPCCVETTRFDAADEGVRDQVRKELGIGGRFVIAYAGSFDGWYLSDEMFDLFSAARNIDPKVFIMILTQRGAALVCEKIKAKGFGENDFFVRSVAPSEMPRYLCAADVGVSFIKPCYSKQASSPTKNAEYLASGLPIIANAGIGDVDALIIEKGVGVLIDEMTRAEYATAIRRLSELGDIAQHCRNVSRSEFDLVTVGGVRYRRLYQNLLNEH